MGRFTLLLVLMLSSFPPASSAEPLLATNELGFRTFSIPDNGTMKMLTPETSTPLRRDGEVVEVRREAGRAVEINFFTRSGDLIRTVDSHGVEVLRFEPALALFAQPMRVGEVRALDYIRIETNPETHARYRTQERVVARIETKERLEVAGFSYEVFRITTKREMTGVVFWSVLRLPLYEETIWYSPEIGYPVRYWRHLAYGIWGFELVMIGEEVERE